MKSTKPVIAVDSDGIICDLEQGWLSWYRHHHDPKMTADKMFRSWDIHKNVLIGTRVYHALAEEGFFSNLMGYRGQLHWLRELSKVANVYVVTSASGKPRAMMEKALWYDKHAPFLDLKHQLVILHDKHRFKCDALVDDRLHNLVLFLEENANRFRNPVQAFYVRRQHGRLDKVPAIVNEVEGLADVYNYYC